MSAERKRANPGCAAAKADAATLELEAFLPYRLSVLMNLISRSLARAYAERFDLSVAEWRVMAALGRYPELSANEVAARTEMDKVRVSRAVARLMRAGRIDRRLARDDRRRSVLRLSEAGLAIYREIVPMARAYERALIGDLAPAKAIALDDLLRELTDRAKALERRGAAQAPDSAAAEPTDTG